MLVYEAGLRLIEVCNLRADQIDLENMVFLLDNRRVPIPRQFREELARHIKNKKEYELVFERGCSTRNLNRQIKDASEASGVKVTSGKLMKAFVVHSLERGQDWDEVQRVSSYTPGSFRTLLPKKNWKIKEITNGEGSCDKNC
jgi:integrase/recombinase XerD